MNLNNNKYNFEINYKNLNLDKSAIFLPIFYLSEKIKKGFKEEIDLNDGLKFVVNEYKTKKNINIDFKITNAPIEFAYCLSGRMSIEFHSESGKIDFLEVSSGAAALFYLPNTHGILKVYGNEQLKIISLHCSKEFLDKFIENSILILNDSIDLNKEKLEPFIEIIKGNAGIRSVANQILESNYSGKMKNIFLESKSNELIVMILDQIKSNNIDDRSEIITKSDTIKASVVESILINNLADVPSLVELSDIASMTHTKLNKIFKKIYGNTVFGYLRTLRLKKAKELIDNGKLSITEIAYETGWSSPSHLTREFKEEFGITPKLYSKQIVH